MFTFKAENMAFFVDKPHTPCYNIITINIIRNIIL